MWIPTARLWAASWLCLRESKEFRQNGLVGANRFQHGRLRMQHPPMNLIAESYLAQAARWPKSGRHILAQYQAETMVVYQAFSPLAGRFAAEHGYFGDGFSLNRMSWIKPNFLWMMYR